MEYALDVTIDGPRAGWGVPGVPDPKDFPTFYIYIGLATFTRPFQLDWLLLPVHLLVEGYKFLWDRDNRDKVNILAKFDRRKRRLRSEEIPIQFLKVLNRLTN